MPTKQLLRFTTAVVFACAVVFGFLVRPGTSRAVRPDDASRAVPMGPSDCPPPKFDAIRTDQVIGCRTKAGDINCSSRKHYPCAGTHTLGTFTRYRWSGGQCTPESTTNVYRCDGSLTVSGDCGSGAVQCGEGGPRTEGVWDKDSRLM
mgnify:CR=1 FL=1